MLLWPEGSEPQKSFSLLVAGNAEEIHVTDNMGSTHEVFSIFLNIPQPPSINTEADNSQSFPGCVNRHLDLWKNPNFEGFSCTKSCFLLTVITEKVITEIKNFAFFSAEPRLSPAQSKAVFGFCSFIANKTCSKVNSCVSSRVLTP